MMHESMNLLRGNEWKANGGRGAVAGPFPSVNRTKRDCSDDDAGALYRAASFGRVRARCPRTAPALKILVPLKFWLDLDSDLL